MKPIKLVAFLFACFWGFEQINAQVSADFSSFQDSCSLDYIFYPSQNLTLNSFCVWDFGNGQTATSQGTQSVSVSYNSTGVYYVTLSVQASGQVISNTDTITVVNDYTNPVFFSTQGGGGCSFPQNYSFTGSSTNPNSPIVWWVWSINGVGVGNYSPILNYQFTQAGVYHVLLTGITQNCYSYWGETIIVGAGNNINAFTSSTPTGSCNASCDGSITITASGSVGPYTFVLPPGNDTLTGYQVTFDNLCANEYSIYIFDQNQCLQVVSDSVSSQSNLSVGGVVSGLASCQNTSCNASFEASVSGGVIPYQYSLDNGVTYQSSNIFDSLCVGNYTIQVQDSTGCVGYYTFLVEDNSSSVFFTTQGGGGCALPQTYSFTGSTNNPNDSIVGWDWSINGVPVGNNATISYQFAQTGNYLVEVSGLNQFGCLSDWIDTITISGSNNITAFTSSTSIISCTGLCDGSISVSATGGVGPYIFVLEASNDTLIGNQVTFNNLCGGAYVIGVYDQNQCSTYITDTVQSLGAQSTTYFQNCDSIQGGNGSFIEVYPSGGTAPYSYVWSNGSTSEIVYNPSPGSISVIITDANGCSYSDTFLVPNNNCYTISGNVYVDLNGNCIVDGNDYPISCWVDLTTITGGAWTGLFDYTDANGFYQIIAPANSYFFDVNGFNVNNYTLSCPATNYSVTINAANPNAVVNFFLNPPPPIQDLRIAMYTPYNFTPGFPTYTTVNYCNEGTIPMSGNVVVQYDPALVWYQSGTTPSGFSINNQSVPASHNAINHTLIYNFVGLMPGQCRTLDIDYETPIGTGLMPGDPIAITATVNPIPGDVTPANNVTILDDFISSSWDPNDKAVSPQGDITVDENDHAYFIRFQNEGNGYASFVVVRDKLDANLDLKSLRGVYASHDYILTVENGNELVFTFNNIQLAPLSVDEAASKGYVGFTVSQIENLPIGTVIENTAEIYFDFNPAIITNTVENEIVEKVTGITNVTIENALSVYPNPSANVFNVGLEANYRITAAKVYDLLGNTILELVDVNSQILQVNLQNAATGVYFLEITTPEGKAVKKLVKE